MAVATTPGAASTVSASAMSVHHLDAYYGAFHAIKAVSMEIEPQKITALIGPSGSGKSTFLRCLNRLHELQPNARSGGEVLLNGQNIYAADVDPALVRRRIGMVFQRPNPFPTKSIFDNVAMGVRLSGTGSASRLAEIVEQALGRAALWDEVKDKLKAPGTALSGGQQQRLCIARALAPEPDILLMDEPAAALDPIATLKIEDLMQELKTRFTIVIVTHNMQQAARASDNVGVFMMQPDRSGALIEFGPTGRIYTTPQDERTEAYIAGRIG